VFRALVAIAFLSIVVQATGLSLAAVRACEGCGPGAASASAATGDGCEGDEETGDCAPDCERCLCCAHHRVVALPRALDSRPVESQALAPTPASEPAASSDPNEIMHVPKRAAA
jgi:hypothetical protein